MTTTPNAATPADQPPARRKFKYTQQLVNIALEELTQDEIAKLCRVSQSIVSGWKNGQSRAYEHQLIELKKRFGHRLHRATFRVYLALVKPPEAEADDWEPMKRVVWFEEEHRTRWVPATDGADTTTRRATSKGRTLQRRRHPPVVPEAAEGDAAESRLVEEEYTERVERSRLEADPSGLQLVQVEGPVTLRHTMHLPARVNARSGRPDREPVARWLIHHLGRGRLVLVRQRRRLHHGRERELWERGFSGMARPARVTVEANDDAARWLSYIEGPLSPVDLVARADEAVAAEPAVLGASLLPFLVRKMLVELNYPVTGLERIASEE